MQDDNTPPPRSGPEIIREVERLRDEPAQFSCFGLGCGGVLVVALIIALIWKLVR